MTATMESSAVRTRDQVAPETTWDLKPMYESPAAWDADFARVEAAAAPLIAQQGKLTSAAALAAFWKAQDEYQRLAAKLSVFASMRSDEDTGNGDNLERKNRVRARLTEVASKLAWVDPELLALPEATLKGWMDAPELKDYRRSLLLLLRQKAHTLTVAEETLLSQAGEIFGAPYETFSLFANADLKFPAARDSKGQEHAVTPGRYISMLHSPDRVLRRSAYESMCGAYKSFRNTVATTLSTSVKVNNYVAKVRRHPSALEASLFQDNVTVPLVDSLKTTVRKNLPIFFKYLALRGEQLGIKDLDIHDMYVPIVADSDVKVPYDQAVEWVREALKPMGAEYRQAVDECFRDRWVDVYENKGKRSGAYSSGCYDSAPYMLLNYQNTLDDVFTLAHELGHSVHTWLANRHNGPRFADYTIFVAEIASMTAEALLMDYLLRTQTDVKLRAHLLNHQCESFRGSVYRQTMFHEFERMIHEADAAGTPLTADWLEENYYNLVSAYFQPLKLDRLISMEWARIPHFYYNFYVYKYSTGFCAAQLFARQILSGRAGAEQYERMLMRGGSADPLDLVKDGGVDLTDVATLDSAFASFDKTVDELGVLLKSQANGRA